MGLVRRKRSPESVVPTPSRLASLPREDLYLVIETSLMEAQMNVSKLRQAPAEDKLALMQWLEASIKTALVAAQEYSVRL